MDDEIHKAVCPNYERALGYIKNTIIFLLKKTSSINSLHKNIQYSS